MNKFILPALALSLSLTLPSPAAVAKEGGDGTRGGADAVSCQGGVLGIFAFWIRDVSPADTFAKWINRMPDQLLDFLPEEKIHEAMLAAIEEMDGKQAARLRVADAELKFLPYEKKLKMLETGYKVGEGWHIFFGCSRHQIASQDLLTGEVHRLEKDFKKIHGIPKALIRLHEDFIRLGYNDGGRELEALETQARDAVAKIYHDPTFNRRLVKAVVKIANKPDVTVQSVLTKWLVREFGTGGISESHSEWVATSLKQLFDAGLDPKMEVGCHLPLVDYAMGYVASFTSNQWSARANFLSTSVVQPIVDAGADLEATDALGRTSLFWAVVRDKLELPTTEALLKAGAKVNAVACQRTKDRTAIEAVTPLDIAIHYKQRYIIDTLRAAGGKTGRELGATCDALPKPPKEGVDCKYIFKSWPEYMR